MSAALKQWQPTLDEVLGDLAAVPNGDKPVLDICSDSREASPNSLFLACRGMRSHGVDYAVDAVRAGATAVAWEPTPGVLVPELPADITLVAVPNLSHSLGKLAHRFFGAPSSEIRVIGVTGTNGC